MVFQLNPDEKKIFELVSEVSTKVGMPSYVVGGYVRDRLMSRPTKDIDIVCLGDGIQLANEVASHLFPTPKVVVFHRFGTAMFRYRNIDVEFVGARKESYSHDSRKPAVEKGSLHDDQNRRDFTINALAVSLNKEDFGEIIDPFDGIRHIEEKILQTPLDPGKTFSDDPLRLMRAVRFSTQLGFKIEPHTYSALSLYKDRINIVSKERIIMELEKIILSPTPSVGFKILFDTGILKYIFPEMVALHGVEIKDGKGHKDNFYHTLQVLDNLSKMTDNLWLRWAAILHDIAKPATKRYYPDQGWTFHGHENLGAIMTPRIFKKLGLPLDHRMKYVQKLVQLHLRPISLTKENITESAIRRLLFDAGDDIDDLMLLCEADITTKSPEKLKTYRENYELVRAKLITVEEKDKIRNWQPPVTGEMIMETFGIPPSREVGIIKNTIREAILDGDISNTYEEAFTLMLNKGTELGLKQKSIKNADY